MNRAEVPGDVANCLCGMKGRARNEGQCKDRRTCAGCGFDRDEYMRRLRILRDRGLSPLNDGKKEMLRKTWGIDSKLNLRGLSVRKKA